MKVVLKLMLTALLVLSIAVISGCGGSDNTKQSSSEKNNVATTETKTFDAVGAAKEELLNLGFGPIKQTINDKDIVVLSTAKTKDDNCLIYYKCKFGEYVYIIDKKNNQRAQLYGAGNPDYLSIFDIYNDQYNTQVQRVIWSMDIYNDKHDKDEKLGIWNSNNTTHYIPLYTNYQFDKNGKMQVGRTSSGSGMNPSHYQGPVEEQYHLDLVNIVFDQMDDFRSLAREQGLKINYRYISPNF